MAVTTVEEPIISRLDRLDNIMRRLEETRGGKRISKSSSPSTPATYTVTNKGPVSSVDLSSMSLEKHCRPIDDVIVETGMKGTLIERLVDVEERVTKLQLEEDIRVQKRGVEEEKERRKKKLGFKQLVKSCVTLN